MKQTLTAMGAALGLSLLLVSPAKASDYEDALAKGAMKMTAQEISDRLANKTVTFENLNSGAKALVYYDGKNGTIIQPIGSDKVLAGYYATDLSDHVCVGVYSDKPMRLRCVNVLLIDGLMHKFELDGSVRGRVIEEVGGNII